MGIGVSRTTDPLRFDVGIGSAGYADIIQSPAAGEPQKSLMPGTTTVTQALDEIFPSDVSVDGEIMRTMVAGNQASLRTPGGFASAARKSLRTLRSLKSDAAERAAHEIENLLADGDVLEHYRLALLET